MCCVCRECCCIHSLCLCVLSLLSWYTILEKNVPVSCMDLFSSLGRWRHICQSGCEDWIYCLVVSAQDEDCRDDGAQGRPTLPVEMFALQKEKARRSPCSCGENLASEDKDSCLFFFYLFCFCFFDFFLSCKKDRFNPLEPHVVARKYQAKLYSPAKSDLLQRSCCKLGQTVLLGTAPRSITIGSVDNFPQEGFRLFLESKRFLAISACMYGGISQKH